MFSLLFFDWTHIPKTQVKSDTVWNEHGAWKKNGAGDRKNSKGRVPKQAQGNPILTYWQLLPTNKHKSLPNQDAQVLDNQNESFVRIKQQHNHGNNNNNSLRE